MKEVYNLFCIMDPRRESSVREFLGKVQENEEHPLYKVAVGATIMVLGVFIFPISIPAGITAMFWGGLLPLVMD